MQGCFQQQVGVVLTMITSLVEYSHKLEYESIKHFVLREINNKLDSLSDKLLISMSKTEGKDINELLEEIDILTDSVKDTIERLFFY